MSLPAFIYRVDGFTGTIVNAIICVLIAKLYLDSRRRCFLFISMGSGIGAVLIVLPEMQGGGLSEGGWYFDMVLRFVCSVIWLIGWWLFFQDYTNGIKGRSQPCAAPNGGLVTSVANLEIKERPPSAS